MNSLSFVPSIDIITAPMYAGKTTELIRRLTLYNEMGMKVLYVNTVKDERTPHSFSTHNSTIGSIPFNSKKVVSLKEIECKSYDVIGIDEAQMFDDLKDVVLDMVEKEGKIVLVCGLNGDFLRKPFGQINDLVPYCDSYTKLSSFCLSCKEKKNEITPAHFTKRIVKDQTTILVGGKESYIPVCRNCFLNN